MCSFTEGYLQGAVHAVTGAAVRVREVECMARGAERCRFEIDRGERPAVAANHKEPTIAIPREPGGPYVKSAHVDEQAIIDAVVGMSIVGDEAGLIPAFSVYLASMPADLQKLVVDAAVEASAHERKKDAEFVAAAAGRLTAKGAVLTTPDKAKFIALIAPIQDEVANELKATDLLKIVRSHAQ